MNDTFGKAARAIEENSFCHSTLHVVFVLDEIFPSSFGESIEVVMVVSRLNLQMSSVEEAVARRGFNKVQRVSPVDFSMEAKESN